MEGGPHPELNAQTLSHFNVELDRLQKMLSDATGFTPVAASGQKSA